MSKVFPVSVLLFLVLLLLGSSALAVGPSVPPSKGAPLTVAGGAKLPGDMARLERELAVRSEIQYRILVVQNSGGEELTAYLERVADQWGEPRPDTLLLVVFAEENYNIRFYYGANLTRMGMTVDRMLTLLRTHYFPLSQQGDVAGGLGRLVGAINRSYMMGMSFPEVDPRIPPELVREITWAANRRLEQFLRAEPGDRLRAAAVGLEALRVVDSPEGPLYQVVYAVLPAEKENDWIAGSGKLESDGWVRGKVQLLKAVQQNGEWQVAFTGP
ncbi:MAG: TPM domain-containing protein [Bacillota bacterium]